jgi:23S rRNA (cytosine1962-C5)-methyltransferase
MKTAKVSKRGADRVRQGHLWIYQSDVVDVDVEGGSIVTVKDERGNFIGKALFSDRSQIALRRVTKRLTASGGDEELQTLLTAGTSRLTRMLID